MVFMYDLHDLYIIQRKSTWAIASLLGISQKTVRRHLKIQEIPTRTYKENKMPTPKGGRLSEAHKAKISASTMGRVILNPETGHGYKWQDSSTVCSYCGQKIHKKQCDLDAYQTHYCSNECRALGLKGQDKGGQVSTFCTECNHPLIRPRWQIKNDARFFCNQTCAGAWKRKNLTGDKLYNYKGGCDNWSDYGPSWPNARFQALERDGHKCTICGITREKLHKEPDVHHIIPFRFFGKERHRQANNILNLICLCPKHHSEREVEDNIKAEHYANIVLGIHIIT